MTLMTLARRDRGKKDELVKIGTAIIYLEDQICEKESIIREQSVIEMTDGLPKITHFLDESLVEALQSEIAVLRVNMDTLKGIIDEIEGVFGSFALESCSMEMLDSKIDIVGELPETIARKISRLIISLLEKNPGLTLPMLLSNEEFQSLETQRGLATMEGLAESRRLIKLKDQLASLCRDGAEIAENVFHPQRAIVRDPAKISEMLSA
jgi:hypothetical protein